MTQIKITPEMLWGIECEATSSHGYGSWLSRLVGEALNGEDLSGEPENKREIALAVAFFLEETTPREMDLGDLPEHVEVVQERNRLERTLTIEVKVYDEGGDYREYRYVLRPGDPRSASDVRADVLATARLV